MQKRGGFTLIELLVVITIIGILATVVLSSLGVARERSQNSSVQQTISNVRTQAEIHYTEVGSYAGMCAFGSGLDIERLMQGIMDANNAVAAMDNTLGNAQDSDTVMCHVSASGMEYALSAPMLDVGDGQQYYCVDSTGAIGLTDTALAANQVVCP